MYGLAWKLLSWNWRWCETVGLSVTASADHSAHPPVWPAYSSSGAEEPNYGGTKYEIRSTTKTNKSKKTLVAQKG